MNSELQGNSASADSDTTVSQRSAGPLRRLGAMLYDTLLVVAILMVVTFVFLVFTRGKAITSVAGWLEYLYRVILLLTAIGFFAYFWTAKGRTLGMQAWRLRVERIDGSLPSLRDALMRLALAFIPWAPGVIVAMIAVQSGSPQLLAKIGYCLLVFVPLNYLSAWFDPQRRSWHDRFLQTRVKRMS